MIVAYYSEMATTISLFTAQWSLSSSS